LLREKIKRGNLCKPRLKDCSPPTCRPNTGKKKCCLRSFTLVAAMGRAKRAVWRSSKQP
jgi:hypothetical protein